MRPARIVAAGAVGVAVAVTLGGCTADTTVSLNDGAPSAAAVSTAAPPVTVVASRTATGGLCTGRDVCASTFTVSSDGSWLLTDGAQASTGVLGPTVLTAVVTGAADTAILEAPAFTGTCPTAYDGSEVVYSWQDAAGGQWTVSACDVEIPAEDPLVVGLDQAETAARSGDVGAGDFAEQAERALAIAQSVVGLPEADAEATLAAISSLPLTTRVVARDGVSLPVTEDYSPTRVNLTVDDGVVTAVSVG